jgi:hypothetical protein
MTATKVTFLGGQAAGNVESTRWHGIEFPAGEPVELDPAKEADPVRSGQIAEIIRKAAGHPYFHIGDEPVKAEKQAKKSGKKGAEKTDAEDAE